MVEEGSRSNRGGVEERSTRGGGGGAKEGYSSVGMVQKGDYRRGSEIRKRRV